MLVVNSNGIKEAGHSLFISLMKEEPVVPNYGISETCLEREEPTRSMSSL